jgi:hypothetical protein
MTAFRAFTLGALFGFLVVSLAFMAENRQHQFAVEAARPATVKICTTQNEPVSVDSDGNVEVSYCTLVPCNDHLDQLPCYEDQQ